MPISYWLFFLFLVYIFAFVTVIYLFVYLFMCLIVKRNDLLVISIIQKAFLWVEDVQ